MHAAIWMNLKNIMLHEESWIQVTPYCMIPYDILEKAKLK